MNPETFSYALQKGSSGDLNKDFEIQQNIVVKEK